MALLDNPPLDTMLLHLPVVLRLATQADLPKLEWFGQYTHFRALFRRTFREQQRGKRLMIVADCNDFPIGQVFIQLVPGDRAYLYALRVMEMFRGQGIGSWLIREAEAMAVGRGIYRATIAAAKDNPGARRLYERQGYRVYADDPGYWSYIDHQGRDQSVHEPCWLLEKRLSLGYNAE
jgi:ribosomal protein S18 acetylase RimI-like enzyme